MGAANHSVGGIGAQPAYQYVDFCVSALLFSVLCVFFFFIFTKLSRALQQFMQLYFHTNTLLFMYICIYTYALHILKQIYFLTLVQSFISLYDTSLVCVSGLCVCVVPIVQNTLFFFFFLHLQMAHKHFFMFHQINKRERSNKSSWKPGKNFKLKHNMDKLFPGNFIHLNWAITGYNLVHGRTKYYQMNIGSICLCKYIDLREHQRWELQYRSYDCRIL